MLIMLLFWLEFKPLPLLSIMLSAAT